MRPAPPPRPNWIRLGEILLAVSALFAALAVVQEGWYRAHLPFQVDYEEGNILNAALRMTHGLSPYGAPHAWPKILNPYGPVTYALVAIPVKLFGTSFTGPRLMVVAASLAVVVFLALLIWHETSSLLAGLMFGPLFLSLGNARLWMAVLRVDMFGLAFSLAGVYVFARSPRRWWLAAALFCVAFYCKHTLVAAPAACALWCVERKDWSRLLRFSATLAGAVLAVFAVGNLLTSGAFGFALLRTHVDLFDIRRYYSAMFDEVTSAGLLSAFNVVALVAAVVRRRGSPVLYYLVCSCVTAITIAKIGSNTNHMLELDALLCAGGGLGWGTLSAACRRLRYLTPIAIAACVLFTLALVIDMRPTPPQLGLACLDARLFVHSYPGERMLSDNIGLLVLAGKPVFLSNPFVYAQLVQRGGWSDQDLQQMIRRRSFDLIILGSPDVPPRPSDRWSPGVVQAIGESYLPVAQFGCRDAVLMWAPRPQ